jgi:hypothetical protein
MPMVTFSREGADNEMFCFCRGCYDSGAWLDEEPSRVVELFRDPAVKVLLDDDAHPPFEQEEIPCECCGQILTAEDN